MAANSLSAFTVPTKCPQSSPASSAILSPPVLNLCLLPSPSNSHRSRLRASQFVSCRSFPDDNGQSLGTVDVLMVPDHWLSPSTASEEAEWLRVSLHKWLDDEYCPEPTNVVISKIAAQSYYKSLMQKTTDLGEILLKMAMDLESISYQESFHGAFSSANAAVSLISQRIEELD